MKMISYVAQQVFVSLQATNRSATENTVMQLRAESGLTKHLKLAMYERPILWMIRLFTVWFALMVLIFYFLKRLPPGLIVPSLVLAMCATAILVIAMIAFLFFGPRTRIHDQDRWLFTTTNFVDLYNRKYEEAQKALIDEIDVFTLYSRLGWIFVSLVLCAAFWVFVSNDYGMNFRGGIAFNAVFGSTAPLFICMALYVWGPLAWMKKVSEMIPQISPH